MNPGQSIGVQLVQENGRGLPVSNVMIEFEFFVKGSFRFALKVGRTNEAGCLSVTYEEIEVLRRDRAEKNVMDYNTKLDDCDPSVRVVVRSEQELLDQRDNVLRFYRHEPEWAKDWPSNHRISARPITVETVEHETRAEVLCAIAH